MNMLHWFLLEYLHGATVTMTLFQNRFIRYNWQCLQEKNFSRSPFRTVSMSLKNKFTWSVKGNIIHTMHAELILYLNMTVTFFKKC